MSENRFIFFHGYDELLWHGYEKNGLIDEFAGVRFCQSLLLPERKKFNELAKKDGKLFKLISDNNYPWYIDRLQGDGYIDEYQYNTELIDSPMPLEAGNYRLTVSYKTKGYRTVKEGKKAVEFTVMPA